MTLTPPTSAPAPADRNNQPSVKTGYEQVDILRNVETSGTSEGTQRANRRDFAPQTPPERK